MDKKIVMFCLFALIAIFIIPSLIFAASFDCAKATSDVEKVICSNADISKLDDELSELYKHVYADSADKEQKQLKLDQLSWLKKRNACLSRTCIRDAYKTRLSELIERLRVLDPVSECLWISGCTKFAKSGANKALWESSGRGDVGSAKAALLAGADPNVCGPSSYERPLHVAVNRRDLPMVRELLRVKANPDVWSCLGDTPLVLAAHNNDVKIAAELLSAGANIEGGIRISPLQMAAAHGYVEMLRTLLSHQADPNSMNGDTSPLMFAARNWHVEAVKSLLESGANPNLQTSDEGTALFDAVGGFGIAPLKPEEEERALKVVKLLVQYGANVNAKTAGQSPLQRARAIKESTIVNFLISVGAKP